MNEKKLFFKTDKIGFAFCIALIGILTGCASQSYQDRPSPGSVYVEPAPQTIVVVQDNYVYYPGYDVYYNSNRRQYFYEEQGRWVTRQAPRGVPVNVLLASPSVRMDFHDSPASHHAAMVQKYPKNWTPPGSNHDQHSEHGENTGR